MINKKPSVLIVDDEPVVCDLLRDELSERGYLCFTALNVNDALTKLAAHDFDVALLDIKLPGISGMELLRRIRLKHNNTAAVMITCVNNIDIAVEAIKLGALDYIVKPFDIDRVCTSVRKALGDNKRSAERRDCKKSLYVGGKGEDDEGKRESTRQIDAIAFGVEAKLDSFTSFSKIVIERTIDTARQLGIPEEEIQRWADTRLRLDSERNRIIESLLDKVQRSPLAQSILGMTEVHLYTRKSSESQN